MKKKQPTMIENGVITGNYYDKYNAMNPIARKLMNGFESAVFELVLQSGARSIHEAGCGEGYLASKLNALPSVEDVRGSDFSSQVIALARDMHGSEGIAFEAKSIYKLDPGVDAAELMVCCEVLEHIEEPEQALEVLQKLASPYCLLSVPREPVWSLMNIVRGKYISDYGNTPGHIQKWSRRAFTRMVSKFFQIEAVKSPLPWTVCLCRKR